MIRLAGDMFGPRVQGPYDMVLYFWVAMPTDTLKIELREVARRIQGRRIFPRRLFI